MQKENQYVQYFYRKYHGRVAIGVGYGNDLSEIFPFVFLDDSGKAIGIVALGVIHNIDHFVYIYHMSAFRSNRGHGSVILKELCSQADRFKIDLSVSAIFIDTGKDQPMETDKLIRWYQGYGFEGSSGMVRAHNRIEGEKDH